MRSLTNLVTRRSWNFGSGRILRLATTRRRGMGRPQLGIRKGAENGSAGTLGAVLGAALLAVLHAGGVQGAADDVVAHAREVLHTTATDHHHRVLLEVVTHAGDVGRHLDAVGQADTGHLAEGRVRLLRGRGVDAGADTTLLRALLEGGALALHRQLLATLADQLADRGHCYGNPGKGP